MRANRAWHPGGLYWAYYHCAQSLVKSLQLFWRLGTHRFQIQAVFSTSVGGRQFCWLQFCDLPATLPKILKNSIWSFWRFSCYFCQIHWLLKFLGDNSVRVHNLQMRATDLSAWQVRRIIALAMTARSQGPGHQLVLFLCVLLYQEVMWKTCLLHDYCTGAMSFVLT